MSDETIEAGGIAWRWHGDFGRIPDTPSGRINGRTHAVAALDDGRVVVFCQAVPGVLFFDADGRPAGSWGDRFVGAHGMSVTRRGGVEQLWLVDQASCEVARVSLDGDLLQRLDPPPADARPEGKYVPTWAEQHPGTGEVWVADGYGGSAVHRYDAAGAYLGRLTGEEGAGRFSCPHGLCVGPGGEFFVADRGNHRIAVYAADGSFLRHRDDVTHSPCGLDFHDGLVLVPELTTGVKLLDEKLNPAGEVGADPRIVDGATRPEGWPDLAGTGHVRPGLFNSPHDACFAPNGDVYVVEWIVGGRITRLERC